jgi:predicted enzyme related to lactoylglutathione lyase
MSKHPFTHIELSATDLRATAKFYEATFGWATQEFPDMNYTTFSSGDGEIGGGFNPVTDQNPAGTVMVYIQTDDLEGTLGKVKSNGGTVVLPYFEVPGFGEMAVFQDVSGNTISLWKAAPQPE